MTKEIMEIIEECPYYNEADSCNECSISEWGFCSWKERIENPTLPNVPICHYKQLQALKADNERKTKALEWIVENNKAIESEVLSQFVLTAMLANTRKEAAKALQEGQG